MKPKLTVFTNASIRSAYSFCTHSNSKYVNQAHSGKENFEKDFEKCHVNTTPLQKVLLSVGSGIISFLSPSRGDMIAVMGEVTGLQALKYMHQKMQESEEGSRILKEMPRISSGAVNLDLLKSYPEGTLGKSYSNFLERYGYSPDNRNAVKFVDDIELAYVAQRYREVHDLFHTLLNMPTNMLGEVTVKWVEAIQTKLPMCAAGALFGSFRLAPKFSRTYSTKVTVKIDSVLSSNIENNEINPKTHSGVMHLKCVDLPDQIVSSIHCAVDGQNKRELLQKSIEFEKHILFRKPPVDYFERQQKKENLVKSIKNYVKHADSDEDLDEKINAFAEKKLKGQLYNWKPIEYDDYKCMQYLIRRGPAEYAALKRVLNEILTRDKAFEPKTLFDFGSGVGTVVWAANDLWGHRINEYYCVDASRSMNELAFLILRNNNEDNPPFIKNVYYRQFFPAIPKSYNIVVSAFSLMELYNAKQRLKTLTALWNNTKDYLVILENGSNSGFHLINEARDYILALSKEHDIPCHVFAPCPHEYTCPMLKTLEKFKPCIFTMKYKHLRISKLFRDTGMLKFSFIIMKKGKQPNEDERKDRFVLEVLKKHRHVVCQMCTTEGEFQRFFSSAAKHGKPAYKCFRFSKGGDLLPDGLYISASSTQPVAIEGPKDQEGNTEDEK